MKIKNEIYLFVSAFVFALRVYLSLRFAQTGTVSGLILCVSGLIACGTTAAAWIYGRVDFTLTGVLIGIFHLSPLAFIVGQTHVAFWSPVFWFLFVVQCWVRFSLGRRCTVTGPVFVSLCERAPYSWIRHPMIFVELLMCVVFALEFPSAWNFTVLAFSLVAKMTIVLWEEKFLKLEESYRFYCLRVPWRWLPGIW